MEDAVQWVLDHRAEILEGLGLLWGVASVYVKMTDTPEDDAQLGKLRALLERFSFLAPRNSSGTLSMPGAAPSRPTDSRP